MLLARFISSTKLSGQSAFINSAFVIRVAGIAHQQEQRIERLGREREDLGGAPQDPLSREQFEGKKLLRPDIRAIRSSCRARGFRTRSTGRHGASKIPLRNL
jgi:hypothetical protein